MSTNISSDEVADDYKNALEDLITNDRYQISNLTMIAKENIEHAEAISRVVQNHIHRTPPARKLPALYVLDSIVKNVGTPYTVYFGRNLHQIFMYAYSQVDPTVRRKLEEMLKTWREPVPGSTSTTPVFPISSTQPIVDKLNRYRTSVSLSTRTQPTITSRLVQGQPYRNTPTPPLPGSQYPLTGYHTPQNQLVHTFNPPFESSISEQQHSHVQSPFPMQSSQQQQSSHHHHHHYHHSPPPPSLPPSLPPSAGATTSPPAPYPHLQATPLLVHPSLEPTSMNIRPPSMGAVDMAKLHDDIDDLTTDAKIECATHPTDQSARTKLASLQSLKEILENGNVSEKDLVDIRDSILQQKAKKLAPHRPTPPPAASYYQNTPAQLDQSYQFQHVLPQRSLEPALSAPPSFINQTNLAELLRATATGHAPSNLTQPPQLAVSEPAMAPITSSNSRELPLLAQLRASGLLSVNPTPPQVFTPLSGNVTPAGGIMDAKFTSASVKIVRPEMITTFLSTRPNQCTTCGRRFTSDDVGKLKKARHLDWHFKTKTRILEAEMRGQNRSWYVDEREWIASREYEDDEGAAVDDISTLNDQAGLHSATGKKDDYVRVPIDPSIRSEPCPIDLEPFKSEWNEELQDFIWKDAIFVGGRYYHASCYREYIKDREKDAGGSTPLGAITARTSTPDSVLGKRKADVGLSVVESKRQKHTDIQQGEVNGVHHKFKFEAG